MIGFPKLFSIIFNNLTTLTSDKNGFPNLLWQSPLLHCKKSFSLIVTTVLFTETIE